MSKNHSNDTLSEEDKSGFTEEELAELLELENSESDSNSTDSTENTENADSTTSAEEGTEGESVDSVDEATDQVPGDSPDDAVEETLNDESDEPDESDDDLGVVSDALAEDEEFLEASTDWSYVANLIRFAAAIWRSDKSQLRALAELFFETSEVKPLVLAEQIESSQTSERAEIIKVILEDVVGRTKTDGLTAAEIRENGMRLTEWAYDLPEEDRKFVSRAIGAIAEHFPSKSEQEVDGETKIVEDIFTPKQTSKSSTPRVLIGLIDELNDHIDQNAATEFYEWYTTVVSSLYESE